MAELPPDLAMSARNVPVTLETTPGLEMAADGITSDTLGLFIGPSHAEGEWTGADLPSQIILFLLNIWDYAERKPSLYRAEVRRTLLHELGHYLGFDENDLTGRGLG